jgi:hypothetical protein
MRHGLSVDLDRQPADFEAIEQLAQPLCGSEDNPELLAQANLIAKNEMVLRAITAQKFEVIEARSAGTSRGRITSLAEANETDLDRLIASDEAAPIEPSKFLRSPRPSSISISNPPNGEQQPMTTEAEEHELIRAAIPELLKLERYEQQAWVRQRRAMYRYMHLRFMREYQGRHRQPTVVHN